MGWRRKNYPIIVVGKKNNKLKFSYTKKQLNNGDILIVVEEVADAYGNILTENKLKYIDNIMNTNKKVIRLTESDLHTLIEEAVKGTLNEIDWKTKYNAGRKEQDLFDRFTDGEYTNKGLANSDEFTDTSDEGSNKIVGNDTHIYTDTSPEVFYDNSIDDFISNLNDWS